MSAELLDTQRAFDSVAAEYDGPTGNNALVQRLRSRTMDAVLRHTPAGGRLLDLGCGTGLDAEFLADRGYRVTGIDWSSEMVRRARERIRRAGLEARVDILHLGMHQLDELPARPFDGAYSDLGPLNCVPDLGAVARSAAARLRPHANLIASVMGRACPWEVALFAARGQWRRAALRFNRVPVPVPLNGRTVWTRYYWPGEFQLPFREAGFRLVALRALHLLVPPPYLSAFAARHQRLVDGLQSVEDRVAGWPLLRALGDHFLIVMGRA